MILITEPVARPGPAAVLAPVGRPPDDETAEPLTEQFRSLLSPSGVVS